jgi:hypothetical protein
LEGKKIIFLSKYGLWDFTFLFLGALGTCLISTRGEEYHIYIYIYIYIPFVQRGVVKFTYKGRFLTIKKAYIKLLY